jgi:hypothetical protein
MGGDDGDGAGYPDDNGPDDDEVADNEDDDIEHIRDFKLET